MPLDPYPITDFGWQELIEPFAYTIPNDAKKSYPHSHPALESSAALNKTIDHTLLKLDATPEQFAQLYAEAREYNFATVCVRPEHVVGAVQALHGTDIGIASVVGFHEGTHPLSTKISECKDSILKGATELDIVLDYPKLIAGEYVKTIHELTFLRHATLSPHHIPIKLILETSQLSEVQIIAACVLAGYAGFDYVKTSTGFNGAGAHIKNVALMRATCEKLHAKGIGKKVMGVKASGGVRTLDDAESMLRAGAGRLGTSNGVGIAKEAKARDNGEVTEAREGGGKEAY